MLGDTGEQARQRPLTHSTGCNSDTCRVSYRTVLYIGTQHTHTNQHSGFVIIIISTRLNYVGSYYGKDTFEKIIVNVCPCCRGAIFFFQRVPTRSLSSLVGYGKS